MARSKTSLLGQNLIGFLTTVVNVTQCQNKFRFFEYSESVCVCVCVRESVCMCVCERETNRERLNDFAKAGIKSGLAVLYVAPICGTLF